MSWCILFTYILTWYEVETWGYSIINAVGQLGHVIFMSKLQLHNCLDVDISSNELCTRTLFQKKPCAHIYELIHILSSSILEYLSAKKNFQLTSRQDTWSSMYYRVKHLDVSTLQVKGVKILHNLWSECKKLVKKFQAILNISWTFSFGKYATRDHSE